MRNIDRWQPTKFALIDGRLSGDPTGKHIGVGSRLQGDLLAEYYGRAVKAYARGRLLDLGCGNVPLYVAYKDLAEEVICLDWPATIHRQEHIDVFADLSRTLPLRDAEFDTVLLTDVLEHIPTPERLVEEISRILAPGGHAIIGVPFLYWLHEVPHDFNRYTRYQLERLMRNAGLDVVELVEMGGSPEVVADIIAKTLAPRPRIAAVFVALARRCLRSKLIRKVSDGTRARFPSAYLVVARKGEQAQYQARVSKK